MSFCSLWLNTGLLCCWSFGCTVNVPASVLWVVDAGTLRLFRSAPQKCYGCYKVLGQTARLCTSSFMLEPFFHLNHCYGSVPVLKLVAWAKLFLICISGSQKSISPLMLCFLGQFERESTQTNTPLAGEAIQYLMYLFLLFFAVCACREAFSHVCYLIPCFLMPSLSDSPCFSVTLFKNGSNSSLLPSQRKGTTALLYWVNAFSHTCSWMGDYLNILNTLLIGIMTC